MDGQPHHGESDCTELACRDSKGTAVKMEPKLEMEPRDIDALNIGESFFGEAGIPMATMSDGMVEVQATGSADDCDHNVSTTLEVSQQGQHYWDPTVEMEPVDLHTFNVRENLFGETGVPGPTAEEVQGIGTGDDCSDHNMAVYTLLELSQQGQVHHLHPTGPSPHVSEAPYPSTSQGLWQTTAARDETKPHLGAMYGPGYNQPYPAQATPYGTSQQPPVKQSTQRRRRRPTATWTPYSSAPPQAHQQVSFPLKAAGGPDPSAGSAAGASQYIDLTGGDLGEAVAGSSVGASVSSPVRVKETESWGPSSHRQKMRDDHNEKERMRRTRLKNAWDALREIVPGLSERTDTASLCELVAEYTRHRNRVLVATYGNEEAAKIGQEFIDQFKPW